MKRKLYYVFLTLFAFAVSANFMSCSDDKEDEPADPTTHDQEIIGKWSYVDDRHEYYNETTYVFRKNGTYEEKDVWIEDGRKSSDTHKGNWSTSGNKLTFYVTYCPSKDPEDNCEGDTETTRYTVSDDYLILFGDRYERK